MMWLWLWLEKLLKSFRAMTCTVYAILMTSHSSCLMVCVVEYYCTLCIYVSCITGVCVLDEKYVQELNACNGTVYYIC